MIRRALVLGAGGHAASAWEMGLANGMAEAGVDVRTAELLVGTSAGARVAVQLASGLPLEELFRRQIDPRIQPPESPPGVDWKEWRSAITRAKEGGGGTKEVLRRIGLLALTATKGSESERRRFMASQLPVHAWPEKKILIAAVELESGERCAFDRNSGIDLVDAVMASSAVAGIWPAVTFRGRRYIDGGFYSSDNMDLAAGFDRVLIAALRSGVPPLSVVSLASGVEMLHTAGARVEIVHPDEATEAAFAAVGGNLLDPSVCVPAAQAGRAQGRRIVEERVAVFWA